MTKSSDPFSYEGDGPDPEEVPIEMVPPDGTVALDGEVIEPEKIKPDLPPRSRTLIGRLETRSQATVEMVEETPDRTRRHRVSTDRSSSLWMKAKITG
ncbi:MAG: hypothetical protein ACLQJR_33525 [Stellaceae bacterium]